MKYIVLAVLLLLASPAWAGEDTGHLTCCGDIPCVMCYDDNGIPGYCPGTRKMLWFS
jgi:hypothetical protein